MILRPFFLATFALCAGCSRGAGGDSDEPEELAAGPDPMVLRLSSSGGAARAYKFPVLDSATWRSQQAIPGIDRILGFDAENGFLAFADTAGAPGWIDLRLGSVKRPSKSAFTSLASADGWAVYGVHSSGALMRLTPSGDWQVPMPGKVLRLVPTPDGSILVLTQGERGRARLIRMRPPDDSNADSVVVEAATRAMVTPMGDRVYLAAGDELLSLSPHALEGPERVTAAGDILAMAATPSGDRVFLGTGDSPRLQRYDRYEGKMAASAKLPGLVSELRMDPLGRYLIARPVRGDSAWIVSLASEELVATIPTAWRADVPTIVFDGSVATLRNSDLVLIDPRDRSTKGKVESGGSDRWFFVRWNGFRPRARGIDAPVSFRVGSAEAPAPITVIPAKPGVSAPLDSARDDVIRPAPPTQATPPSAASRGWTVSFAAVLSLERAREIAASISVGGQRPRVVTGGADGTTVYRVIMGPFESRDEAERFGKASGHSFWVFEGAP